MGGRGRHVAAAAACSVIGCGLITPDAMDAQPVSDAQAGEAGACAVTTPETLATTPSKGWMGALAVQGGYVYWIEEEWVDGGGLGDFLRRVAVGGGTAVTLADSCYRFALAGDTAYCASGDLSGTSLVAVPLAGGAPSTLATGLAPIDSVFTDGAFIYFAGGVSGAPSRTIWSLPVAGGSVSTLVTGAHRMFAVDQTNVYWTSSSGNPWGSDGTETLHATSKDGALTTELASATGFIVAMVKDATHIYFGAWSPVAHAADGTYVVPVGGGTPALFAPHTGYGPYAIDGDAIYSDVSQGTVFDGIFAFPLDGATPRLLNGVSSVAMAGLVVDDAFVYWPSNGDYGAHLLRICKPGP